MEMDPEIQVARMQKRRNVAIDSQISNSNSIDNVKDTTISGYRSMHLTQLFRYGLGSKLQYRIGDPGPPIVTA